MAGDGEVRVEIEERPEGRVARVTVDRRARLNVLDGALIDALAGAFTGLAGDDALRVVVLAGAGERAFIGGADIGEMVGLEPASAEAFITRLHEACAAIRACPVPVIASVSGYCLGAGLEVAAACDVRIASADATFGMPEVRVGIPSVIEAALLPSLIGWGKTRELLFTGEAIGAAEALAAGLVEAVAPAGGLDAAVERRVSAILAAGPRAMRAQKALIARWERLPLAEAIEAGIAAFRAAYAGDEPRARMRAFLERPRRDGGGGDGGGGGAAR